MSSKISKMEMKILILGQGKIFKACLNAYLQEKGKGLFEKINIGGIFSDDDLDSKCIKIYKAPLFTWNDLKEIIEQNKITVIISIQFPKIIPKFILEQVNYRAFNLHNAKLPDYRGHNSLSHEIINNEKEHVITIHWMQEEVDRGFLALDKVIKIELTETAYSLYNKCLKIAPSLFLNFMKLLEENKVSKTPILGEGVFYSIKLEKEVSNASSVLEKDRYSRALYFPGCEPAYIVEKDKKIYLLPKIFWEKHEGSNVSK